MKFVTNTSSPHEQELSYSLDTKHRTFSPSMQYQTLRFSLPKIRKKRHNNRPSPKSSSPLVFSDPSTAPPNTEHSFTINATQSSYNKAKATSFTPYNPSSSATSKDFNSSPTAQEALADIISSASHLTPADIYKLCLNVGKSKHPYRELIMVKNEVEALARCSKEDPRVRLGVGGVTKTTTTGSTKRRRKCEKQWTSTLKKAAANVHQELSNMRQGSGCYSPEGVFTGNSWVSSVPEHQPHPEETHAHWSPVSNQIKVATSSPFNSRLLQDDRKSVQQMAQDKVSISALLS